MRRFKRFGVFMLIATIGLVALVGCKGKDETPEKKEVENENDVSITEIDIISRQLGMAAHPQNEIWEVLDGKLQGHGVKANIEYYPSTDYVTQGATIIASRDYPDMMEWWSAKYPVDLEDLSNDGIIRPLDDLIDQYGPNIKKVRNEENSTFYRNSNDGKIYGIPARSQDLGNNHIYVIRKDWLDALGLEVPDSLDELYEVLKAFKDYDADGDGDTSDTIPFGVGSTTHFYSPLAIALSEYGIVHNYWNVNENNNLEYYAVMDETIEAIKFVRKLYQEGLMEPEFVLLERDQLWDNMANGKYGICAWYVDRLDPSTDSVPAKYFENNPDSELVALNPFPDKDGIRRYPRMINTQQMIIFSDTSEEEAIACIKFLDYLYSDEGGDLADLGVEGVHWRTNEDGKKEILIDAEQQKVVGYSMYNWMAKRSNLLPTVNDYSKEVAQMMLDASVANPVLTYVTEAAGKYSSGLSSLVNTSITSMIMDDNIDIDKAFEDFVEEWYRSGGQEWTDELNEIHKK